MTRVRWTTNAANDLTRIVERIREENSEAAQRVARTIYTAIGELRQFPHCGRIGLAENTRELVFSPWPYIAELSHPPS
jgi:toxin ParE1/3/4